VTRPKSKQYLRRSDRNIRTLQTNESRGAERIPGNQQKCQGRGQDDLSQSGVADEPNNKEKSGQAKKKKKLRTTELNHPRIWKGDNPKDFIKVRDRFGGKKGQGMCYEHFRGGERNHSTSAKLEAKNSAVSRVAEEKAADVVNTFAKY